MNSEESITFYLIFDILKIYNINIIKNERIYIMKVKIFDEEDEKDLEEKINTFLDELEGDLIDIKYQVSASVFGEEQIYCFSAIIIYNKK